MFLVGYNDSSSYRNSYMKVRDDVVEVTKKFSARQWLFSIYLGTVQETLLSKARQSLSHSSGICHHTVGLVIPP